MHDYGASEDVIDGLRESEGKSKLSRLRCGPADGGAMVALFVPGLMSEVLCSWRYATFRAVR